MRTRKKKWTAAELAGNPRVIQDPAAYVEQWRANESGRAPLHMEIGCGKGRFITQTAMQNPDIHYIAIERDPTILAAAARLSRGRDCSLAFMMLDAAEIMQYFKPGDITRLYINFCDPWPNKKKWAKRRLTHGNFLTLYEQLQISELFFKTDNRLLFEFSIESFSERGWRIRNVSLDLHHGGPAEGVVMTEYEERFSALGMPIYRLEASPPPGNLSQEACPPS